MNICTLKEVHTFRIPNFPIVNIIHTMPLLAEISNFHFNTFPLSLKQQFLFLQIKPHLVFITNKRKMYKE